KLAADAAAVAAMRSVLRDAPFDGTVVIGEGEKDAAPMLANGERLGDGSGPACDVAVDPLDGTRLVAEGIPGSICVLALAPRGTMLDPGREFYMDKAVTHVRGVDLAEPPSALVPALAAALGHPPRVIVLDKPRHVPLVSALRAAGASVTIVGEGDIAAGVAAATRGSGVDLALGTGGTPEGVITACAVRALGGVMRGRIGSRVVTAEDLVGSDRVLYVAASV
ncbi:MAG TPA: fructose-bisphosphatase class II, partial [Rhodoglobus sp.]|nr:fructose-bisphosphatase class II [Rhodoglobus sp.]